MDKDKIYTFKCQYLHAFMHKMSGIHITFVHVVKLHLTAHKTN